MKNRYVQTHRSSAPLLLALLFTLFTICACADKDVSYRNDKNWAYLEAESDKPLDVFLICPTVDMGEKGNYNMSLQDTAVKKTFVGALNMERGIYDPQARMFAPFYRQVTFPVYSLPADDAVPYFDIAYEDVKKAFLTYMDTYNEGRPFILAGFSQGADLGLRLMKDLFEDPVYSDLLVAAYLPGWRVTQEELEQYPWLKMARGETDTGVVITFNSEAPETESSLIVPAGCKTYSINPLNWRTDEMPAGKSENLGACFTSYDGTVKSEIPNLTGAYLEPQRGTLKIPDVQAQDYSNSLFPDGVYHLYDYQFFYRNLQKNAADRFAAWMEQETAEPAAA